MKRFGFRPVLIYNGVISAAFLASYGLITAGTPHALLIAALLAGGFFRSLQFTALNALGYADIDQARMSRATSFASVAQQMSSAVGVAVAAASVESDPVAARRRTARRARHDADASASSRWSR